MQKTTHSDGGLVEARVRTRRELNSARSEREAQEIQYRIIAETPPVKFGFQGRAVAKRDVERVFDKRQATVR